MSTIKVDTIQTTGGTEVYTAKAWAVLNGVGSVSVTAGGNVSSMTDYGIGNYGVSYTSSFPDANYSWIGGTGYFTDGTKRACQIRSTANDGSSTDKTSSSTRFITGQTNQTVFFDTTAMNISVTR